VFVSLSAVDISANFAKAIRGRKRSAGEPAKERQCCERRES
jgi:hypothetical protein